MPGRGRGKVRPTSQPAEEQASAAKQESPSSRVATPGRSTPEPCVPTNAPGPSSQETVLLNAPAGALRAIARLRPTKSEPSPRAIRLQRRSVGVARSLGVRWSQLAHAGRLASKPGRRPLSASVRRGLVVRLASERMIPIVAAIVVLGASLVSFQPAATQAVGGTDGAGADVRLAIGGVVDEADQLDPMEVAGLIGGPATRAAAAAGDAAPQESFTDDGTIYKPVAVNTEIRDGKGLLQTYTVQSGDTLTGIASRYGVSMMTVWWANKLTAKDELRVGQKLVIPPVDGLVVTVKVGDTLESLAAEYKVDPAEVLSVNELDDPTLIVGQTLVLPDAAGAPIPTPKPAPPSRSSGGGGGGSSSRVPPTYSGGAFVWPVVGGGNYISRGFIYGHYGLDIAADYGVEVQSAIAGQVIFAGWKSNGGGYQVWISHGSGMYTTYNHLASVSVAAGQSVGRGQQIGRNGSSGNSTGPHTHLEVWIGEPWNGGYRVNPLRYY